MKAIKDFTTPTAYARWTAIRSNPMNDGLSSKLLLSQILLQVPETFGLSFSVATTSTPQVQQPSTQNVVNAKLASNHITKANPDGRPLNADGNPISASTLKILSEFGDD